MVGTLLKQNGITFDSCRSDSNMTEALPKTKGLILNHYISHLYMVGVLQKQNEIDITSNRYRPNCYMVGTLYKPNDITSNRYRLDSNMVGA